MNRRASGIAAAALVIAGVSSAWTTRTHALPVDSIDGIRLRATVDCRSDTDIYEFVGADGGSTGPFSLQGQTIEVVAIGGSGGPVHVASLPPVTDIIELPPGAAPGYDQLAVTISGGAESGTLLVDRPVETCTTSTTTTTTQGAAGRWQRSVHPISPIRAFDSRVAELGGSGRLPRGTWTAIDLGRSLDLPTDLRGVIVNLTATGATGNGYVATSPAPCESDATPADTAPLSSALNFDGPSAVANQSVAATANGHELCVYVSSTVHLVVDVTAFITGRDWFEFADSGLEGVVSPPAVAHRASTRMLDTRMTGSRVAPGTPLVLDIRSQAAAWLTFTVVRPSDDGFLQVYPCRDGGTETSAINFRAGEVRAATLVVEGSGGDICVNTTTATDLVVDVRGVAGREIVGRSTRVFDTRTDARRPDAAEIVTVPIVDRADVPADAVGVEVNLIVVRPESAGHATVFPCEGGHGGTSTVNFSAGQNVANHAVVPLSTAGTICVATTSAADIVVDLTGFVAATPELTVMGGDWCGYAPGLHPLGLPWHGGSATDTTFTYPMWIYGGTPPYRVAITTTDDVTAWFTGDALVVEPPSGQLGWWTTSVTVSDTAGVETTMTATFGVTTLVMLPAIC